MWFFTKKQFLRELLEHVVDIHNHVLPGIDDGAKDLAMTLEMLTIYKELGIKSCIATPHTMLDYYGNTVERITQNFSSTNESLKAIGKAGFITQAASEYMLDDGFEKLLKARNFLFLKDAILLTELSYFQKPNNLFELCYEMVTSGITPVLAHPERYSYIKNILDFEDLKARGFQFQLNLLSLSGHYGDAIKKMSLRILEAGMYDYVGTDAHKPEHLNKIKELQIPKNIVAPLTEICKQQQAF